MGARCLAPYEVWALCGGAPRVWEGALDQGLMVHDLMEAAARWVQPEIADAFLRILERLRADLEEQDAGNEESAGGPGRGTSTGHKLCRLSTPGDDEVELRAASSPVGVYIDPPLLGAECQRGQLSIPGDDEVEPRAASSPVGAYIDPPTAGCAMPAWAARRAAQRSPTMWCRLRPE